MGTKKNNTSICKSPQIGENVAFDSLELLELPGLVVQLPFQTRGATESSQLGLISFLDSF